METGEDILVRKLRDDGSEAFHWSGRLLERDAHHLVLAARFNGTARDLGYVVLEDSDLFVEFYYFDRWYNVFQIYSSSGQLKGWYCNVSRPIQVEDGVVLYTDLVLDVFVYPSGEHLVLDEDEFDQESRAYAAEVVAGARQGLQDLVSLAQARWMPERDYAASAAALDQSVGGSVDAPGGA